MANSPAGSSLLLIFSYKLVAFSFVKNRKFSGNSGRRCP